MFSEPNPLLPARCPAGCSVPGKRTVADLGQQVLQAEGGEDPVKRKR